MAKRKQISRKAKKKSKKDKPIEASKPMLMSEISASRGIEDAPEVNVSETTQNRNYAGMLIANEKRKDDKGTLGGVLVSDKGIHYGVTCYHVVKQYNQEDKIHTLLPEESVVVITEKGDKIGVFNAETAFINSKLDIALIALADKFDNKKIDSPTTFVTVQELQTGTEVYFFNDRIKKKAIGVIRKINQEGAWRLGRYENAIFVSDILDDRKAKKISDQGDSGSWLLRVSDNALVGIVFSESSYSTIVMPISEVIDTFKQKNITLNLTAIL